jgi:hypothetical protein
MQPECGCAEDSGAVFEAEPDFRNPFHIVSIIKNQGNIHLKHKKN